ASQIDSLRNACRAAARKRTEEVTDVRRRLEDLEEWLGEIALLNQTLMRLLVARGVFTRETFQEACRQVDLLDGVRDGKLRKPPLAEKVPEKGPDAKAAPRTGTRKIRRVRRGAAR
ncbi:MAG: hypothetical protein MUC63_00380, partial [Planctomycetes bacterium]|nr:hypothetical protein [Planctomycetota bacterium]